MAGRVFTPEQANAALARVRPLAERMVERYRSFAEAQARLEALSAKIAGNGGGIDKAEAQALAESVDSARVEVERCLDALQELGVLVKDVGSGILDFPAVHDGEDVLLCWRVGEPEVAHWHGLEGGFAARRPLPF